MKEEQPDLSWCKNLEEKKKIFEYLKNYKKLTNIEKKFFGRFQCCICGKNGKHKNQEAYYCSKHFHQLKRHGRILSHSRFTPNELLIDKDFARIILRDINNKIVGSALISKQDIHRVIDYKWYFNKQNGYVYTHINNKIKSLHRFIFKAIDSTVIVDHINGQQLDNTIENLRKATISQNIMNSHTVPKNKLRFKGIRTRQTKKGIRYIPYISLNGKQKTFGRFATLQEAIIVRLQAEKDYYAEGFQPQRHLFKQYNII